jgi:ribonuclease E
MKENFIEDLKYFENKNKIKIDIIAENSLIIPEYIIDFQNKSKKITEKIEFITKLKNLENLESGVKNNNSDKFVKKINIKKNNFNKKKFYNKKYFKKTKQAL